MSRYSFPLVRMVRASVVAAIVMLTLPAQAQKVTMTVQPNVGPDLCLHLQGTVCAKDLHPHDQLNVNNELHISVEFIEDGGRFRDLPDSYSIASGEAYRGNRLLTEEQKNGVKAHTISLCGQALSPEDDDQPFQFDGVAPLEGGKQYRIVATLQHQWLGNWPAWDCTYDVKGPYPVKLGAPRTGGGGGMLGSIGRFLKKQVSNVGEYVLDGGIVSLPGALAGGAIRKLQGVLRGDLRDKQDALGQALQYIGKAAGGESDLETVQEILGTSGEGPAEDIGGLTEQLVKGLVSRKLAPAGGTTLEAALSTAALGVDEAQQTFSGQVEPEIISQATDALDGDLQQVLGLRDLQVAIDQTSVTIRCTAPEAQGQGSWTPIITYALVNAALTAPWVDEVILNLECAGGDTLGIQVPRQVVAQYANGSIDAAAFQSAWLLTDGSPHVAVTLDTAAPAPVSATTLAAALLIGQSELPSGWLASARQTVSASDITSYVAADVDLQPHAVQSSAMQMVQVGGNALTIMTMLMTTNEEANGLLNAIAGQPGESYPEDALRQVSTEPAVQGMVVGNVVYLIAGEGEDGAEVAALVTARAAAEAQMPPPAAGDQALPTDASTQTATTGPSIQTPPSQPAAVTPPDAMPLAADSIVKEAVLCTGVDENNEPTGVLNDFPPDTKKVGLYLCIEDAPANSEVLLEWWRNGKKAKGKLLLVTGDHKLITYLMPARVAHLPAGSYWLEINEDDNLVARLVFTVR